MIRETLCAAARACSPGKGAPASKPAAGDALAQRQINLAGLGDIDADHNSLSDRTFNVYSMIHIMTPRQAANCRGAGTNERPARSAAKWAPTLIDKLWDAHAITTRDGRDDV